MNKRKRDRSEGERMVEETRRDGITIDADQVPEHELYTKRPEPLDQDRFRDASGVIVKKDEIIMDDSSLDDPLAGPPPEKKE